MNQNGSTFIIGLIVGGLVVAGVIGVYIFGMKQGSSTVVMSSTPLPTSGTSVTPSATQTSQQTTTISTGNDSTYSNAKHNYSISVPSGMTYTTSGEQDMFYQGEMTICCGYQGPNLNITMLSDGRYKDGFILEDSLGTMVIAGQSVPKTSSIVGVHIGPLKHEGDTYYFEVFGKDKSDKDFQQIYDMLQTFKFLN